MFRKLTSFFFKEEEIEVEETEQAEDHYKIPKLKPLTSPKEKPKAQPDFPHASKNEESWVEETEASASRKSVMITADTMYTPVEEKPKQSFEKPFYEEKKSVYKRHEIISPMYGGPEVSEPQEIRSVPDAKNRKPVTEIISPIYGKVVVEETKTDLEPSLFNLDVEAMIAPEIQEEEVQVSLYDYLDGLDDDE